MNRHHVTPRRLLFLLFLLHSAVVWAAPVPRNVGPQNLSLARAIQIAMAHNPDILAQRARITQAIARAKQARSSMMPSISVLGVGQVENTYKLDTLPPEMKDTLQTFFPDLDPNSLKMQVLKRWNLLLGVSVIQPLTSLYPLYKLLKIRRLDQNVAKDNLAMLRRKIRKETIGAYLQVYQARAYLKIAIQAKKLIQAHLRRVKILVREEAARKAELLQVQVKQAEIEHAIIRAQSGNELAESLLKYTIGLPLETKIRLTERFADPPPPFHTSLATCTALAMKRRAEIHLIRTRMNQARLGRQAALFQYVPTMALIGGYQFSKGLETMFPMHRWFAGALFTWSWEWGKKKYRIDEIEAQEAQAQHLYAKVRLGIQLQVKRYFLAMRASYQAIAIGRTAMAQAAERLRMEEIRYKDQAATSTDVLTAQTAMEKANADHANALYGYYQARAALEEAVGGTLP
ncbi:MAG: TolC family protein [Deltaproteobacteria bacterium]|nr:TolC family protein [Deltaproteobacteria bacterium]